MPLEELVRNFKKNSSSETELLVVLHNWVRDHIKFGFTADFETVSPGDTVKNGMGHCNAQADLLCHLLTLAGFESRLAFVYIDKEILRYAIPSLIYYILPYKLFHAVTQVNLEGKWVSIDSYILTKNQFSNQMNKLVQKKKKHGFGLHINSECVWDGRNDCFSLAKNGDIDQFCQVYDNLAQAIKSSSNTNRVLGVHFNTLLKPIATISRTGGSVFKRYINYYLH